MTALTQNESHLQKIPDNVPHNSRLKNILITLLKIVGLLACLYFFVVSLNLMSISFPLIGGKYASEGNTISN